MIQYRIQKITNWVIGDYIGIQGIALMGNMVIGETQTNPAKARERGRSEVES